MYDLLIDKGVMDGDEVARGLDSSRELCLSALDPERASGSSHLAREVDAIAPWVVVVPRQVTVHRERGQSVSPTGLVSLSISLVCFRSVSSG